MNRSWFWKLLLVLSTIVVLLRVYVFDVWTIPDNDLFLAASIEPTLSSGDVVLVLRKGTPGFGDLVRCFNEDTPLQYNIGRIVAVQEQEIEISGHQFSIDGKPFSETRQCPESNLFIQHPTFSNKVEMSCEMETLGRSWHYTAILQQSTKEKKAKEYIEEGHVFLLSDNRDFHYDSRDFGQRPLKICKERIVFRLWSKNGWKDEEKRLSYIH